MALNSPAAGLRRIHYDAKSTAKVQLAVTPGEVLSVSDDLATQLLAQSAQFKDLDAPPKPAPVVSVADVEVVEYGPVDELETTDGKPNKRRKS